MTRRWIPRRGWRAMPLIGMAVALASPPAWAHTFPPVHTVVVQLERCELALLIGYTAGTGDSTQQIVARVASQPSSHALDAMRDTLTAFALAPLAITLDGHPLMPSSVRAKVGVDAGGTRPVVVVLLTFALRGGGALAISSKDPRTTRVSWQDHASGRIVLDHAPAQAHWHRSVSSFVLPVAAASGCAEHATAPGALPRSNAHGAAGQ